MPAWSCRVNGVQLKSQSVVVRNHRWPGAYAIYQLGTFYNVYIGNGQKEFIPDKVVKVPNEVEDVMKMEEADPDPMVEKELLAKEQPDEEMVDNQ